MRRNLRFVRETGGVFAPGDIHLENPCYGDSIPISLAIGVGFVAACRLAAETLTQPAHGAAGSIARESLTIIGRVAMWRPVQIFLDDWWPVVGRIHVYDNLKCARVAVIDAAGCDRSLAKTG